MSAFWLDWLSGVACDVCIAQIKVWSHIKPSTGIDEYRDLGVIYSLSVLLGG
ncbi:MAG: hypothetical protein ABFS56_28365 [Pseudomonadota bacterium]